MSYYTTRQPAHSPPMTATSLTRDELLSHNSPSLRPTSQTLTTLRKFRLFRDDVPCFRHYRGRRSGVSRRHGVSPTNESSSSSIIHNHLDRITNCSRPRTSSSTTINIGCTIENEKIKACSLQSNSNKSTNSGSTAERRREKSSSARHTCSTNKGESLKFGLINARSAVNKAGLLHSLIETCDLKVLAVTETWVSADSPECVKLDLAPTGFSVFHQHRRSGKKGGGTCVIYNNVFKISPYDTGLYTTFEHCSLKIRDESTSVILICLYRPPDTSYTTFIEELSDLLDKIIINKLDFILCGDFNSPYNGPNPSNATSPSINRHLSQILDNYHLLQHVTSSTHLSGNILDLIITPISSSVSNLTVSDFPISDHLALTCDIKLRVDIQNKITFSYRRIHKIDFAKFNNDLLNSGLLDEQFISVDDYVETMNVTFRRLLDLHAPVINITKRVSTHPFFELSTEAVEIIRNRRRAEKLFHRDRNPANKKSYLIARNAARKAILKSRSTFISKQLISASNNPKLLWKLANSLLHRNKKSIQHDDECFNLTSQFAAYFQNKISKIHQSLSSQNQNLSQHPIHSRPLVSQPLLQLPPVSVGEVSNLIKCLPNKSSPLDILPPLLIKRCSNAVSAVIAKLANLSFSLGVFPSTFKTAQILPLLKKPSLDKSISANYRPISNLSTISKLLERLMLNRVRLHLINNQNYSQFQSAYRNNFSTETSLLHLLDCIYSNADRKKASLLVGLDLSAAFDTVDHTILINRLHDEFGLQNTVLSWFKSYLSNRTQYVKVGNHCSSKFTLGSGVPQGSVLGPLLFTVYTSPISSLISNYPSISFQLYADDIQLCIGVSKDNFDDSTKIMSDCVSDLNGWFKSNKMQLNPDKSEAAIFGTPPMVKRFTIPSIELAGSTLMLSSSMKILGVILDQHLTFLSHVNNIIKSSFYHIKSINHFLKFIPNPVLHILVRCLIFSKIDYCNSLLYGAPSYSLKKLQRLINTTTRLTKNNSLGKVSEPAPMPILPRINLKMSILTYNILNSSSPPYLSDLLHLQDHEVNLRSTGRTLKCARFNSNFSSRGFRHAAPTIWNKLPAPTRTSSSLSSFKKLLTLPCVSN